MKRRPQFFGVFYGVLWAIALGLCLVVSLRVGPVTALRDVVASACLFGLALVEIPFGWGAILAVATMWLCVAIYEARRNPGLRG